MSLTEINEIMEKLRKSCIKWQVNVELKADFSKSGWYKDFDWKVNFDKRLK